ncbi:Probable sensor-like histidine kinase YehU [Chryseobacterium gleum]|uniref:Histidine kinase n=2 Tax=Chryseobacterium gleum TaxID=250 RepID=A0ABP2J1E2_CHRGE|nr:histidine kinase [Chryseobacterium gleum]EFK37585.1 histidine kinase [Chryseobacterium gleum ATCC 35910]QQY32927.1 histidine kinase [Chryseobacterium gleum]VEE09825.1 Probable sensor-like histidine kinase YehU [Chryseobacterium gleum]
MTKSFVLKEYIFTFIFWLVLAIVLWFNFQSTTEKYLAMTQAAIIAAFSFTFTHFLTNRLLPKALREKKMKLFLVQLVMVIFMLSLVFSVIFTYLEVEPKDQLPESFRDQLPFLWKGFYMSLPASFLINGAACGIKFYNEHGRIERDHILLQQAHLENQLKLLQDQINPHVVFNIMNHIHILMKTDIQLADFLLLKFSDILRYQLYHCNQPLVPLDKEIEYLQNLVEVEKLRWGNELDVKAQWQINNRKASIAPLLLVPFVENAFKYVCRLPGHKGYVKISCKEKNHSLYFYVENSYSDMATYKKKDGTGGIGLQNVKKRLKLQYPDSHDLSIQSDNHVFRITLILTLSDSYEL